MDKHIIVHKIPKELEGKYYTIDFPMPPDCERVTVSYSYKRFSGKYKSLVEMVNVVDLGLMDKHGSFLGWSGSAKDRVFIGPYASTKGYKMTCLEEGVWKIIVGAYKIPDQGLEVTYEITYDKARPRWLKGDLHMHSDASDGQHDISTLTKRALKMGLDFIALSNHNNYSENMNLPKVPGLTLIPAVEWTHYKGHMNFYGVKAPFENSFIANSEKEMLALVNDAKKMGALISVNHPKCSLCPYLWESRDCFDMVEVWNGPMRKDNIKAIQWWHSMVKEGKRIPLIGGSDFHKDFHPVRMGNPISYLYVENPSEKAILQAMKEGRSYVSSSVKGVKLNLSCKDKIMGDELDYQEGIKLKISAENLKIGSRVRLVTNKGLLKEWKNFKKGKLQVDFPLSEDLEFAYILVIRKLFKVEWVRGITNPLYFKHNEKKYERT